MHHIDNGLRENFFQWKGRLNRRRYFMRSLALFLVGTALYILMIALAIFAGGGDPVPPDEGVFMGIVGLFSLIRIPLTVSGFMLMIRRLHDIGLSGYFCLLVFIPFVNLGLVLYLFFKQGVPGPNAYGPDPLGAAEPPAQPPVTDIAPPKDRM